MNFTIQPSHSKQPHTIHFCDHFYQDLFRLLEERDYKHIILACDEGIRFTHGQELIAFLRARNFHLSVLVVPNHEKNKNLSTYISLINQLEECQVTRSDVMISFGGGITGDMSGFLAATYLRGIDLIQVPTTLLSMVDSSVGSKVGVNTPKGKNRVGAFYDPIAIFINVLFLKTLPKREINCGLGEMLKHGLLADIDILNLCNQNLSALINDSPEVMKELVFKNCLVKSKIVAQDPREANLRMLLNFGHTVGHAIENVFNYKTYSHGECVAYGLMSEMKWAVTRGNLDSSVPMFIDEIFKKNNLMPMASIESIDPFLQAASYDKKKKHDTIKVTLLTDISSPILLDITNDELPLLFKPLLEST